MKKIHPKQLFFIVALISSIHSNTYAQEKKQQGDLYHENGTVAYDSSLHVFYYDNKIAVFNPLNKKFNYSNANISYECSFDNLYYSNGNIASNGLKRKVFYPEGMIAYDDKTKFIYNKKGEVILDFNKAPDKQYTINEENLSITVYPKKKFQYKMEMEMGNYKYVTDFRTYLKFYKKNDGENPLITLDLPQNAQ